MLVVVAHEVVKGEPVVGRDEVDAMVRPALLVLEQVGTARDAFGDFRDLARIALDECPDVVAILPVPLRPAGRKTSDGVKARRVPTFGDSLHAGKDRVARDLGEDRLVGKPVAVLVAAEIGR